MNIGNANKWGPLHTLINAMVALAALAISLALSAYMIAIVANIVVYTFFHEVLLNRLPCEPLRALYQFIGCAVTIIMCQYITQVLHQPPKVEDQLSKGEH